MSDRIAVTVMVDPDVWRASKNKLSVTRSDFINEQLCIAIDAADDEETVLRENRVYTQISTRNQDDTFPIWKTMANLKYAER